MNIVYMTFKSIPFLDMFYFSFGVLMKPTYLFFALLILTACGKSSDSNYLEIPGPGTAAPLLNLDPQSLPLALAPEAFSKAKPDSVVECQSTDAGDTKCRLASESKILVLEANPNGDDRTYQIEYENSCKRQNVHPEALFASGIIVRAQPDGEGDVHGEIYLNKSSILTIRGKGDLRLEEPSREMLHQILEKACVLTVRHTLASSN